VYVALRGGSRRDRGSSGAGSCHLGLRHPSGSGGGEPFGGRTALPSGRFSGPGLSAAEGYRESGALQATSIRRTSSCPQPTPLEADRSAVHRPSFGPMTAFILAIAAYIVGPVSSGVCSQYERGRNRFFRDQPAFGRQRELVPPTGSTACAPDLRRAAPRTFPANVRSSSTPGRASLRSPGHLRRAFGCYPGRRGRSRYPRNPFPVLA
jgi:hypothetical protein